MATAKSQKTTTVITIHPEKNMNDFCHYFCTMLSFSKYKHTV